MKKTQILLLSLSLLASCNTHNQSEKTVNKSSYELSADSIKIYEDAVYLEDLKSFNRAFEILKKINGSSSLSTINLQLRSKKESLKIYSFDLESYSELVPPYRTFYPFIDSISNQTKFLIIFDNNSGSSLPLKISFEKGQIFIFGKKYKLITGHQAQSLDIDQFDSDSFLNPNFNVSRGGYILKTKDRNYLLFTFNDGPWYIHHLFDITRDEHIEYYILYSIYTLEDVYFVDKNSLLNFRQKYFYLQNTDDASRNKYQTYVIP